MFELMAALKEAAKAVKAAAGVEVMVFSSMEAQVGEFISVTNYDSLADFEEKGSKVLASPAYQAAVKKFDGPGSYPARAAIVSCGRDRNQICTAPPARGRPAERTSLARKARGVASGHPD